jgi:hypothetical protein
LSSWWTYHITVFGDRTKMKELEKTLPDLTYTTVSGDEVPVFHRVTEIEDHYGHLSIDGRRYYNADTPIEALAERFPTLGFAGTYYNDAAIERNWRFEARNGKIAAHEEYEDEIREMTPSEIKERIIKRAEEIARLQDDLTNLKDYFARRLANQVPVALPEAEIKDILDDIDVSRPDGLTAKVVFTRLQKAMIAAEFDEGVEPPSAEERAIVAQMNEFAREDRVKEQTAAA